MEGVAIAMKRHSIVLLLVGIGILLSAIRPSSACAWSGVESQTVVVVVGAEGEAEFGRQFATWADRWREAACRAEATFVRIGREPGDTTDRELVKQTIEFHKDTSADTMWLILIGHGTFDGRTAKFNLRGPDVTAAELAEWLKPYRRPLVVIDCTSSSSPFMTTLARPNTVVITATKSGNERNFARFGDAISATITDPSADLDKDEQTSALEAFLIATDKVRMFYDEQTRLITEHALLDDNGDGKGTPADWFQGTRAVKSAADGIAVDGLRANQLSLVRVEQEQKLSPQVRQQRDALELELGKLRGLKGKMDEAVYYQRLEEILRKLATLYEAQE